MSISSGSSRSDPKTKHRAPRCTRTSPLPLLPSGPGGVGGIASRGTRPKDSNTFATLQQPSGALSALRAAGLRGQ
jgi:hypothetical protein